jgi:hypothetical protein
MVQLAFHPEEGALELRKLAVGMSADIKESAMKKHPTIFTSEVLMASLSEERLQSRFIQKCEAADPAKFIKKDRQNPTRFYIKVD